jgi:hypothetical protein
MAEEIKATSEKIRSWLAFIITGVSIIAITLLAIYTIYKDPKEAKNILNVVLPVFASWVGTILAFYYGRENFETANAEVRKIIQQITPEQRAMELVSKHMRPLVTMSCFIIPTGKSIADFMINDLRNRLSSNISRLPIIDANDKPKFMIHESSLNKYVQSGGQDTDTIESFIKNQKADGFEYGDNKGFVVVSEQTSIGNAKRKMDSNSPCMDIFVTKTGSSDEPLLGWLSNTRLAKLFDN